MDFKEDSEAIEKLTKIIESVSKSIGRKFQQDHRDISQELWCFYLSKDLTLDDPYLKTNLFRRAYEIAWEEVKQGRVTEDDLNTKQVRALVDIHGLSYELIKQGCTLMKPPYSIAIEEYANGLCPENDDPEEGLRTRL